MKPKIIGNNTSWVLHQRQSVSTNTGQWNVTSEAPVGSSESLIRRGEGGDTLDKGVNICSGGDNDCGVRSIADDDGGDRGDANFGDTEDKGRGGEGEGGDGLGEGGDGLGEGQIVKKDI